MKLGIVSAPAGSAIRASGLVAATAATATFALATCALLADAALAQQPAPTQPARPPARQTQPAKPPAKPAEAPPPQAAQPQQQIPLAETPPLIFSPWTKVCGKDQAANAKEVCFTVKEARLDTGQFVASAGVIELEGEQKKLVRVTLPLGLMLRHGTRMIIDQQQPTAGNYTFCLPNGCWADFEVAPDYVAKLKKGQTLLLQAINMQGQAANFAFPLADFAKSNEGPPTDPKVLEEQQKKLQEELQARADKARKELEAKQQQQGKPAAPAR